MGYAELAPSLPLPTTHDAADIVRVYLPRTTKTPSRPTQEQTQPTERETLAQYHRVGIPQHGTHRRACQPRPAATRAGRHAALEEDKVGEVFLSWQFPLGFFSPLSIGYLARPRLEKPTDRPSTCPKGIRKPSFPG
jgi:hypothetical protein